MDDPATAEIDGAVQGEKLTFTIWNGRSETTVEPEFRNGNGSFKQDELLIISSLKTDAATVNEFTITAAFPNPFNNQVEIRYYLTEPSDLSLSVFDTRGRLIDLIHLTQINAGAQSINWSPADHTASGIYFF